jgi:ArsR family transcriptional regulator, arsenate/arsenite/antimonite-responsive transcriptional repressor
VIDGGAFDSYFDVSMDDEALNHERLAAIFKALGDPCRLSIFEALRGCSGREIVVDEAGQCRRPKGSLSVGEVCCRLAQSSSTVSHHLKELRIAGLIRTQKSGRWIFCSVNPEALAAIHKFLGRPLRTALSARKCR